MEAKKKVEDDDFDYEALLELLNEDSSPPPTQAKKKLKPNPVNTEVTAASKYQARYPPITIQKFKRPFPLRLENTYWFFEDFPEFQPNLSPKEILQAGSFGGTYFQDMTSRVTGDTYSNAWREFPLDWFEGLTIGEHVASPKYKKEINKYKVSCGSSVQQWEELRWVTNVDPYGWFQWYCRFFLGRRCSDDYRQISRALGIMGPTGRWRKNLINRCLSSGKPLEETVADISISPKIRQLLQQWGYVLTLEDLLSAAPSPNPTVNAEEKNEKDWKEKES